jgi:hypothetical protein
VYLGAKLREYTQAHAAEIAAHANADEPTEPTPFTCPPMFKSDSIHQQQVLIKAQEHDQEVWQGHRGVGDDRWPQKQC